MVLFSILPKAQGGNGMPFKNILIPVDFSTFSQRAVDYGLFLAGKFCAKVILFHAVILLQEDVNEETHFKDLEERILQKEKDRAGLLDSHHQKGKTCGINIESKMVRGFSAADAILDFMSDNDIDLVIMGTHGSTGLKKWMSGSVTERVVRLSSVPVLTIHQDFRHEKIEKILVPVDFSDYSRTAVEEAVALSKIFNARLEFMHSVDQEAHPTFHRLGLESILSANDELREPVVKNLIEFTGLSENEAVYRVTEGRAYKEIKKLVEDHDIDLIVMATRGLSQLEHFLVGSTAERVVNVAPCPVLTVARRDHTKQ
jgi:nucleotide-binding universal stress UspA family protein